MCDVCKSIFLTIAETAEIMRIKPRTLDNLRWRGEGPPFRRHGGRIVYHRDELFAWSEQRRARMAALRGAPARGEARAPISGAAGLRLPAQPAPVLERQR
jgi:hypothetical protein